MKPVRLPTAHGTMRFAIVLGIYALVLLGSLWMGYELRFDFEPTGEYLVHFTFIACWLIAAKLLLLWFFGQFESLLTYFGFNDAKKIFLACFLGAVLALLIWAKEGIAFAPPRAVILTDLLLSFVGLCSVRTSFRLARQGYFFNHRTEGQPRKVAIIGAGDVGSSLVRDMQHRPGLRRKALVFFDDDAAKWGTTIHGVPVVGPPERLADTAANLALDEIIIAMPSAPIRRIREVVYLLGRATLPFTIVPSYEQLLSGKVSVSQVRPVEIEDLLGRQSIDLNTESIRELVEDRVVMITGAGGSIGSELCRQLAGYSPRRLLLVERCEGQLFQIEQQLLGGGLGAEILPLVADFCDEGRMRAIFSRFAPSIVFHAGAHKHVPLMEQQSGEAVRNNALGTRLLARIADEARADRFVLISTDKAIRPTNVMGASKRLAELYIQAFQQTAHHTRFIAVRFGNVLGSSGSVIPTFKQQIAAGGPVTVTHPEVSRYFMTVREAAGLVLQSATQGQGGEIFVLNMGKSMRITDLARQLIELSGLRPDVDIEIRFTGLRPGEKLHEELIHESEDMLATSHPHIMSFVGQPMPFLSIEHAFLGLQERLPSLEADRIKLEIQKIVPEYTPYLPAA
ncbi:MAG TPA: nucleoside-diphosphate sugar epimerase/dehydratase [Opitutaceae bacterium]|nr:nucleoside-diphosphate sugar epimerase/dehydratase [Opitutaceae bacterium]